MKDLLIAILFLGAVLMRVPVAAAQADEGKFSFGKVVSTSEDRLLLREYDLASDAVLETEYFVSPETKYGNIGSLSDLVAEDDVVVDYKEDKGQRSLVVIVKEMQESEVSAQHQ